MEQSANRAIRFALCSVSAALVKAARLAAQIPIAYPMLGQTHPDPILAMQQFRKLVLTKTYVAVYKVIDDTVYVYHIVKGKTDYPKLLK